jgi:hypothetical protein
LAPCHPSDHIQTAVHRILTLVDVCFEFLANPPY